MSNTPASLNSERTSAFSRQVVQNPEATRRALAGGVEVNRMDADGLCLLHHAARMGRVDSLRQLLAAGADVNALSYMGDTALHWAVLERELACLSTLLDAGADIDVKEDTKGFHAIHLAAIKGDVDILAALLAHGACIKAESKDSYTPLHAACSEGHVGAIRALLAAGADVERISAYGSNALHYACLSGEPEAVSAILEHGEQREEGVEPLLEAANDDGDTPWDVVKRSGPSAVVGLLDAWRNSQALEAELSAAVSLASPTL